MNKQITAKLEELVGADEKDFLGSENKFASPTHSRNSLRQNQRKHIPEIAKQLEAILKGKPEAKNDQA